MLFSQTGQPEYSFSHILAQGERENGDFFVTAYVSIPYASLPFKIKDSLYQTSYHIILQLVDKKMNIYGDESFGELSIKDPSLAISQTASVEETLEVVLPKGRYNGNLTVSVLGATRQMKREFEMELFHRTLGSIRLKNSAGKILLKRPFDNRDTLMVSVSVYDQNIDSLLLNIDKIKTFPYPESLSDTTHEVTWKVPLEDFLTGKHEVFIQSFHKGKKTDQRTAWFNVQIPFKFDTERYEELVDKLMYITTIQERNDMKSVQPEARQAAWDSFWTSKDPTPQTEYNEELESYFAKIAYCEKNFSYGDRGYLSDRAKVYMELGPPDDVEEHPFEMNTFPYVIWTYNLNNLELVFEDKHGFGEYILVYPPGFLSSLGWD